MRRITINGKSIPFALLASILMLTGAGAAAGVTFENPIEGEAVTKVDAGQTVAGESLNFTDVTSDAINQGVLKTNDKGTAFRVAVNINQGSEFCFQLKVNNQGNDDLNGQLLMTRADPLQYEATSVNRSHLQIGRTSLSTWNFHVEENETAHERNSSISEDKNLEICIAAPDDIEPGFYTTKIEIEPTDV